MKRWLAALLCLWLLPCVAKADSYVTGTTATGGVWAAVVDGTVSVCAAADLALHPDCTVITKGAYDAIVNAAKNSPQNIYQAAINAGITLTCSTTPALSGTYQPTPLLVQTLLEIVAWYTVNGNSLPAAATQITVKDTANALHSFATIAQAAAFYKAVVAYSIQLFDWLQRTQAGQTPTLPSATSSAC